MSIVGWISIMVLDLTQFREELRKKSFQKYWRWWTSQSSLMLGETNGWRGTTKVAGVEASGRLSAVCGFHLCELTAEHLMVGLESLLVSRARRREEELDSEWDKHEQNGTHWDVCGRS